MDQNQTACTNCKQITTQDGKVAWVCEHCGSENPAVTPGAVTPTPTIDPATMSAQAAVDQATGGMAVPAAPTVPVATPTDPTKPAQ